MLGLRKTQFGASVALAASLILTLAACSSDSGSTDASPSPSESSVAGPMTVAVDPAIQALLPAEIAAAGTLSIGTELGYPPMEYTEADGVTLTGFDIDMANDIATLMGLTPEIKNATFDSIIPSVQSNRYDLGISSFTITPERIKEVDFVSYLTSGDSGVVPAGNPMGIDLDKSICGTKVGVLKGSTQETVTMPQLSKICADAGGPEIALTVIAASDQMPIALASGRVDALVSDTANAAAIAQGSDGKFELTVATPLNSVLLGVLMNKDSGLAPAVQAAIQSLIDSGRYQEIAEKYDLESSTLTTAEINPKS
ncbi:MAG: ABC transporter substrate-binding protein [Actinomycetota bacterium]|nr:ABC transporter substrate-binding protein [Actinomycetota bacterium]